MTKQTQQPELEFPTDAPINQLKLSGQNKKLYDYLVSGKSIHCLHPAKLELGIGYLNSRCSDLINKFKVKIEKKYITVNDTVVVEYKIKL
jgi:hypothetical protein